LPVTGRPHKALTAEHLINHLELSGFVVMRRRALVTMLLCDRSLRLLQARGGKARIDWTGAGLLTAAVSAWLLMLSWGGVEMPWTAPPILGLGLTPGLARASAQRCRSARHSMLQ
jgi:hypothetical protein